MYHHQGFCGIHFCAIPSGKIKSDEIQYGNCYFWKKIASVYNSITLYLQKDYLKVSKI